MNSRLYFELSWARAPRNLAVTLTKQKSGHDVYIREVVPRTPGATGVGRWFHAGGPEEAHALALRIRDVATQTVGAPVEVKFKHEPRFGPVT